MRARVLAVTIFCGLAVTALRARAQESETTVRAREAFNRGVGLYQQRKWAEALASFREAFELRPHPAVRVNLANCLARLGKPVDATYHFRRYMQERGTDRTPEQRNDVQREIDGMRMNVSEIELDVQPPEAEVTVDGGTSETRIGSTIYVTPGHHALEARAPGRLAARAEIDVAGGERKAAALVLERAALQPQPPPAPATPAASAAPTPPPRPEPPASPAEHPQPGGGSASESLPWLAVGGAVLTLGVAVTLSALSLSADGEHDRSLEAARASITPEE